MTTGLIRSEFPLLRRLTRDLDTFFDRFGFEKPMLGELPWTPDLELFEKGDLFVLRADLPGLKREDVKVDVSDTELTISGERRQEREDKEKGIYRTERFYGSFMRTIALPEGVKPELAKAVVKDGVLEVTMPIARVEPKKRRVEIEEGVIGEKPGEKPAKHAA